MSFDQFWQAYPNKKAKGAARKAFATAIKRAGLDQIIEGVEQYKTHKEPWRAWMHPATWLNGECWDDEYEPEVSAQYRSYDTWTDTEKQECERILIQVGEQTAITNYRYTRAQIERLRGQGYLQPKEVAG